MNSKVTMALRIILGLILLIFGASKFINFMPTPELPEAAADFMGAMGKTGYMIPLIGAVEVIVGLLLILNKWTGLALIILAPVALNMVLFHVKLAPGGMGLAALVTILNAVLIYANWDKFKSIFD